MNENNTSGEQPLPPSPGSTFVRMFRPEFARLVEDGDKCQTIRPVPKRMPKPGDIISCRAWNGKPYRSKQRILREATITEVCPVRIASAALQPARRRSLDQFARDDGFSDWRDLTDWFAKTHGLPFEGVLICWSNND